jgi:hypothetical protein
MGWLSPTALFSPDGKQLVYNAWQDYVQLDPELSFSDQDIAPGQPLGRPSLRLHDFASGSDSLLADSAYSVAWRSDGTIAYVAGERPDFVAGKPFLGEIVVRSSMGSAPEPWTTKPARYVVVAWADQTLIAYEEGEGERLDVVALSGPGTLRVLSPDSRVVAVSPDGTLLCVERSTGEGSAAALVDVSTGRVAASLHAPTDLRTGQPVGALSYGGSWAGDRIVAEQRGAVVVLKFDGGKLSVDSILNLPTDAFPMGVHEPTFVDRSGANIVAWAPVPGKWGVASGRLYQVVECTLAAGVCEVAPPVGSRTVSVAVNPSRP